MGSTADYENERGDPENAGLPKPSTMKTGDRVSIYHDPVTQTEQEGTATLIRELSPGYWKVRFLGDPAGYTVNRFVSERVPDEPTPTN